MLSAPSEVPALFQPVRHWLEAWPGRPDHLRLQALAEAHPRYNDNGQRIRFEAPVDDGLAYETRLWESGVVATRLAERIGRGPTEAEVYDLAEGQPLEALLVAMARDDTGIVADRLGRFLDVGRHVHLEIGGDDLLALGMDASPHLGDVLRNVLHLKLNGVVSGRDEELAAARLQRGTS